MATVSHHPSDPQVITDPQEFGRLVDAAQAHNRRVLARMTPHGRRAFATYLRTRDPGLLRPTHSPRPRSSEPRARGAGRPAVRRSELRAKGGDSGDGDPDESEPPGHRLNSRDEIAQWADERARSLQALANRQLHFDEVAS